MQNRIWAAWILIFVGTWLGISDWGHAQESGEVAAEDSRQDDGKVIYVPFQDLSGVFEKADTDVILPYSEYRRLLEFWKQESSSKQRSQAVITRADYAVLVEGDLARVTAKFKVKAFGTGWSSVPLTFEFATIGDFKADENVLLQGQGAGKSLLLLRKAGEYDVEFQLGAPVKQSPGARIILFRCPPVAVTNVTVTAPGKDQSISIAPAGQMLPNPEEQGENTIRRASVGGVDEIRIQLSSKDSEMPAMDLLASVNNQTLVTIADGLVHTETWLKFDVLRGELQQTRIVLPKSARLRDVYAEQANLSSWSSVEQDGNQIVTVKLPNATKKPPVLILRAETKLEEGEFSVAGLTAAGLASGIHALDAVRESGQIAIRHSADLTVNVVEQQGLVRIENSEATPKLTGSNALLFKFYSQQMVLKLAVKPVQPRLSVDHQINLTFTDDDLRSVNHLNYVVEQAGVFDLKFQLPADFIVDQVTCPPMKEYAVAADSNILTLTLRERTQGQIAVTLTGRMPIAKAKEAEFNLPLIQPLQVDRESGRVFVFAKDSLEVKGVPTGLEAAQPLSLNANMKSAGLTAVSAWTFNRRPVVIPVRVDLRPTRLRAQVATQINVQPEVTQVTSRVSFLIQYAGMDEFRFEVPESISKSIQIDLQPGDTTSVPIKQKTAAEPVNGSVIWTIQTQRPAIGKQTFQVTYPLTTPAAQGESSASSEKSLVFDLIRPLGTLDAEGKLKTPIVDLTGEVSVTKDRTLAINASANAGASAAALEQIDIRELKLLPADGTLAFRYYRDDAEKPIGLTVKSSRFEIQDVVSTVVSRGLTEIVLSEDQAATYRCRFLVKSTERQRLLVALPKDLDVLGAFLNEREVKLEKTDSKLPDGLNESLVPFWINVARVESSETPFLLTFQFLWKLTSGQGGQLLEEGVMQLPLPVIVSGNQSVVQELKTVVWIPEEHTLVGDPEPFLLQKRHRPLSFLLGRPADHNTAGLDAWVTDGKSGATGFAELPTDGRQPFIYSTLGSTSTLSVRVWNKLWMTLLFSGAVGLIGWILSGTSWENKLGMLLLMAFAATLYGVFDSHGLSQGLYVARYGLEALILIWILRSLFRKTPAEPASPAPDSTPTSSPTSPTSSSSAPPQDDPSPESPPPVVPPPGMFDPPGPEQGPQPA